MTQIQLRGAQDYIDLGMKLTTGSNEVCKLYDSAVNQLMLWREDESLGGLKGTVEKMLTADPDFLMGNVISNNLQILSSSYQKDKNEDLKQGMAQIDKLLADSSKLTSREIKHGEAVQNMYDGYLMDAAGKWEEILLEHPFDSLALKFAQYTYFLTGSAQQARDSVARVLPRWRPDHPLYGYVLSMHAFGLHEAYNLPESEAASRKSLEINKDNAWATHTLCHVLEMQGRAKEGAEFMEKTVDNWMPSGLIACHNNWHWALYHVELGNFETALSIFDNELLKRGLKSGSVHDFADMGSLLFRLQMEGVNVGNRWDKVYNYCKDRIHDHNIAFYDLHILLSCLRANQPQAVAEMMSSIEDFVKNGKGLTHDVMIEVGHDLVKSFQAYNDEDYAAAVDLLNPIRYKVFKIGGSQAQRDVVNLFLIQAAIKSPCKEHNKLAKALLNERRCMKKDSPLTERLMAKTIALHGE